MDRMNDLAGAVGPRLPGSLDPCCRPSGRDLQYQHRELFARLAGYNLAVEEGVNRKRLLAVFDDTFECVKKYFRSLEALPEPIAWQDFQQNRFIHFRIAEELAAHRIRLTGNDPLDAVECAHAFDALLIQFIREHPPG